MSICMHPESGGFTIQLSQWDTMIHGLQIYIGTPMILIYLAPVFIPLIIFLIHTSLGEEVSIIQTTHMDFIMLGLLTMDGTPLGIIRIIPHFITTHGFIIPMESGDGIRDHI